jgi:hypothetical protein
MPTRPISSIAHVEGSVIGSGKSYSQKFSRVDAGDVQEYSRRRSQLLACGRASSTTLAASYELAAKQLQPSNECLKVL